MHEKPDLKAQITLRRAQHGDEHVIRDMFYHAIYMPPGEKPLPPEIVEEPRLRLYWQGWGRAGDIAYLAFHTGQPAGAVWVCRFSEAQPGYGFVAADIPELAVAMLPGLRGQGCGTMLLTALLADDELKSCRAVSLSVDKNNPSVRLYVRFGFQIIAEPGDDYLMLKNL